MKKVFELMFSLIILFSLSITVSAADTTWTSTKEVELPKGQNQFNVQITVDEAKAYAGAEFGVQTPDGVSIRSVTYSQNGSKVAPTEARGLTWFSYYSGNNDFTGKVTATLTLEYKGTENTSIVIDNISVYTKDGTTVDTAKVTPRKIIEISREGANNPVIPLDPPTDSNSNPTESSNTDSTSSNTNGTTKSQTTKSSSTRGINASTVSTTSTTDATNNLDEDQTDLDDDDIDENEEENNSDNILEVDDENTSKAQKDPLNTVILIVLIISIISNAVIGYFYIKNKNKIKEK